jgi:hypothetical protein
LAEISLSAECGKREPMPIGRYRINSPTVAIFETDGRPVADTVPEGAIIEIDSPTFVGDRLIEIRWDGKRGRMYTQDLRKRAESVRSSAA